MTQNKQYIEQHKNLGRVWAMHHLCGFYPGICLTTEGKAQKNLSQGSRREPAGHLLAPGQAHFAAFPWNSYTAVPWSSEPHSLQKAAPHAGEDGPQKFSRINV
jgi:hypothetical protein